MSSRRGVAGVENYGSLYLAQACTTRNNTANRRKVFIFSFFSSFSKAASNRVRRSFGIVSPEVPFSWSQFCEKSRRKTFDDNSPYGIRLA